jgi:NAD(P)-dependent dehydrogenase (short-subunit alcohol dehydrogenase family)
MTQAETGSASAERDEVFTGKGGKGILDRMRLDGRSAVVTGGGQGIGRAFVHALGEAGARVAIVDLDGGKAEAVAEELREKGAKAMAIAADVTRPEEIERYVDTVANEWGDLTIAVNNAGMNKNSAAEETPLEEWDRTMELNLRSVFLGCQAAARVMLPAGYGKIINTASMASLIVPHPQKQAAYNTSKAGVVHLTRSVAAEWADRGVRVNAITPGIVRTALIEESDELRPLVDEWLTQIPAGRLAEVTDLQAAVVYLASEASDYVTGHNLVIEGGQTLW